MNRFGYIVLAILLGAFGLLFWSSGREAALPASPQASSSYTGNLVIPVVGVATTMLTDSWHDPRSGGARAHQAIDIAAPRGTPVVAAFSGTVSKLFTSEAGGLTAYVRQGDWQAYYAHLDRYVPGLAEGQQVASGQTIGTVGDSGNAGPGNTHLHFALHRMASGDKWWQGTPVNPYPLLAGPLLAGTRTAR